MHVAGIRVTVVGTLIGKVGRGFPTCLHRTYFLSATEVGYCHGPPRVPSETRVSSRRSTSRWGAGGKAEPLVCPLQSSRISSCPSGMSAEHVNCCGGEYELASSGGGIYLVQHLSRRDGERDQRGRFAPYRAFPVQRGERQVSSAPLMRAANGNYSARPKTAVRSTRARSFG